MKPNTMLESAIERRNFYQGRMIENMVNIVYFTKQMKTFKPDTQERVDAKNSVSQAEKAIKNDERLLESFDELIASIKKGSK